MWYAVGHMSGQVNPGRQADIDESLIHLLKRVEQLAADIHAARVGRDALTQRQFALLSCLSENEGASQAELVRRTGIDRSTLADLAARLEGKGLLRRRRCRHDRRANQLFLTTRGRQALEAMAPLMAQVDRLLLSALSSELAEAFVRALRILADEKTARRLSHRAGEAITPPPRRARPAVQETDRLPTTYRELERWLVRSARVSSG